MIDKWLMSIMTNPIDTNEVQMNSVIKHTLSICSSCNAGWSNEEFSACIEDIENLSIARKSACSRSGELMHIVIQVELIKNGWELLQTNTDNSVGGSDAKWDGKNPKVTLQKGRSQLAIVPIRCLSSCDFPHVLAMRSEHKYAYQFGNIEYQDISDLIIFLNNYCESVDGYSNRRSRPGALSRNILARIPPSDQ